ncbi:hypothetical protein TVAG_389480 [Trichomonas vaginalis G3]|uniref:Uncharacterized protein n=1 Tax=Trichomonas vaginalis (strain ATCC PRA-98 / G3) TaxID=412133 RepID=A2E150_TRIV3|nr:hypothetical protein TVAGG3_0938620 [Trichomonas vaginalis G3]EAY13551.1 hypothetical protein TVAG_389480 [Trichomonas vaginalis G3]KAI5486369.1 hypothetical protein TVAGG3_0938620 [Trichomonas vaginalis G3]|eukprot:XP_001325774.1 hypothetical protein [Trichomonas vaginalis G3]
MILIFLFLLSFTKSDSRDDQKLKGILDEIRQLRIEVEELRNIIHRNYKSNSMLQAQNIDFGLGPPAQHFIPK